ncbi:hypothetical protein TNCV_2687251 [Trichonephila clavipes]|nr:hypothetical protein TNCV_2687251 [Trichonephila clavipes]
MITNFFIPELNNHDVQELWFQQDGATCHTARATIDLLKDTFGDRLISRFEPVNWPPRSCDLTPLDYFLRKGKFLKIRGCTETFYDTIIGLSIRGDFILQQESVSSRQKSPLVDVRVAKPNRISKHPIQSP